MLNLKRTLALSVCAAAMVGSAHAQEKVTLRFADWMATSHYTVSQAAVPFINKVKELSGGKLEIQHYPAEQLGKAKDALSLLQSGVADIANISPSYIADKFALTSVAELPAMFDSACQGSKGIAALVEGDGLIAKQEFKPNRVRVLASIAYAPYKVLTVSRKVSKVDDFKGLKLRTAGGAMDLTATALGAVSVRMPGPDVLPSMSRGTLDGALFPLQSVKVFDLQTVLKHQTTDGSLGSFVTVYAISDRAWNALSEENRKVLAEAGAYTAEAHCKYVDTEESKVAESLAKDGVAPNPFDDGQLALLEEKLAPVNASWAKTLDDRGRPGSETLKAFTQAIGK
jgi:TRAP-type C4-dicarboxylate transport system substrate-binding protein